VFSLVILQLHMVNLTVLVCHTCSNIKRSTELGNLLFSSGNDIKQHHSTNTWLLVEFDIHPSLINWQELKHINYLSNLRIFQYYSVFSKDRQKHYLRLSALSMKSLYIFNMSRATALWKINHKIPRKASYIRILWLIKSIPSIHGQEIVFPCDLRLV
jgi:hypothetical protein